MLEFFFDIFALDPIGYKQAHPLTLGFMGVLAVIVFASLNVLFLVWLERKVIARIQVRYGPNRTGPFGLLQPLADTIKLFTKEDIIPAKADRLVYTLAATLAFSISILPAAAVGIGAGIIPIPAFGLGVLYIMATASLATIPVLMAGWASNNKFSLLAAMRTAGQSLSYEMPLVLSLVGVVAIVGSMATEEIVAYQAGNLLGFIPRWMIILQPLAFIVFFTAVIAEIGRIPFDLPESESELVAGFHTEYSGMKFALLLFAEYIHLVVGSALVVTFFLGGWTLPFIQPILDNFGILGRLIGVGVFIGKMYIIILILMWIRGTLMRTRIDQLLQFGWKILLPLALVNIVVTGLIVSVV